jgi:hypothetical protein
MTVTKRQREQKKRERQQAKLERRAQRKNEVGTEEPEILEVLTEPAPPSD